MRPRGAEQEGAAAAPGRPASIQCPAFPAPRGASDGGVRRSPFASPSRCRAWAGAARPKQRGLGREEAHWSAPLHPDSRRRAPESKSGTERVLWRPPADCFAGVGTGAAGRDLNIAPTQRCPAERSKQNRNGGRICVCVCVCVTGKRGWSYLQHSLRFCVCGQRMEEKLPWPCKPIKSTPLPSDSLNSVIVYNTTQGYRAHVKTSFPVSL